MQLQEPLGIVSWILLLTTLQHISAKSIARTRRFSAENSTASLPSEQPLGSALDNHPKILALRAEIKALQQSLSEGDSSTEGQSGLSQILNRKKRNPWNLESKLEPVEITKIYKPIKDKNARRPGTFNFHLKKELASFTKDDTIHSAILVLYKRPKPSQKIFDIKNKAGNTVVTVYKSISKKSHELITSQVVSLTSEGYIYLDVTSAVKMTDSRVKLKLSHEAKQQLEFEVNDDKMQPELRLTIYHKKKRSEHRQSEGSQSCQRKYVEVEPHEFRSGVNHVLGNHKVKIYFCEGSCRHVPKDPFHAFAKISQNLHHKDPSFPAQRCVPSGFKPLVLKVSNEGYSDWRELRLENAIVTDCSCV